MRTWQARLLDDLVCRVYHVNLQQCSDFAEFRDRLNFMVLNLQEISSSLGGPGPQAASRAPSRLLSDDPRIRRAAESLRVKANRLLALCGDVPESFADQDAWRIVARNLAVNYEVLRFEAGHLYRLVIPESPFGVLRSAL